MCTHVSFRKAMCTYSIYITNHVYVQYMRTTNGLDAYTLTFYIVSIVSDTSNASSVHRLELKLTKSYLAPRAVYCTEATFEEQCFEYDQMICEIECIVSTVCSSRQSQSARNSEHENVLIASVYWSSTD